METIYKQLLFNNTASKTSILLVDDDADDMLLLSSSFSKQSSSVKLKQAYSVKEAMNFLNRLPDEQLPAVIVLDYNMPVHDGLDFLKMLKDQVRFKKIKKIILSTAQSHLIKNVCLENGADACYPKPNKIELFQSFAMDILEDYMQQS